MSGTKLVGVVLLVLGAILLYFGVKATGSPIEQGAEILTGTYTDNTMWYLIGGGVCAVVGLVLLLTGRK